MDESTKNDKIDKYFKKKMNIHRNKKILKRVLKIMDDNKNKQIVFVFGVGKKLFYFQSSISLIILLKYFKS